MQDRRLIRLAERQFGVFSRKQAVDLGYSRAAIHWKLASGDWVRVVGPVYRFAGNCTAWAQHAFAATLLGGKGTALSHFTAAFLFRLDGLSDTAPRPVDLTVPRHRGTSAPGLRIHRSTLEIPTVYVRRFPVTSLARTLVDLSQSLSSEALEFALDSAQRQFHRVDEWLLRHFDRLPCPPPPGVATLRDLLALRTDGHTDSPLEVRIRRALRATTLPRPTLRHQVFDDAGYVMRLDFAWPLHKVALHVDGYRWHHQRERFERDARQRTRLAALGWTSLIVTRRSLESDEWLHALARLLAERAPQLRLAV